MQQGKGITYRKLSGLSAQALRVWGLIFLLCGAVGYGIIANVLIPTYGVDADGVTLAPMSLISVGSILQMVEMCALPVFAFLLVQGFQRTTDIKRYMIRVATTAVLTEIPYNLCKTGDPLGAIGFDGGFHFDIAAFELNPVFGMLLCILVLFFFQQLDKKGGKNILIKVFIWAAAFFWVAMLHIELAHILLIVVSVLWLSRKKKGVQIFTGCIASFISCLFISVQENPSQYIGSFIAPLTFLLIHFYNEEPGEGNKYVNYLAYPVMLLAIGLIAKLAF